MMTYHHKNKINNKSQAKTKTSNPSSRNRHSRKNQITKNKEK